MRVHHSHQQQGQVKGQVHLQAGGQCQGDQVQADHRQREKKVLDRYRNLELDRYFEMNLLPLSFSVTRWLD